MVYAYLDYGLGGSLFLNGELFRGSHGAAGEVHYLPVPDPSSGRYVHAGDLADGYAILTAIPTASDNFPGEMVAELEAADGSVFEQLELVA